MNGKYQLEIENFINRFKKYQASRIVLYGIGRYTAALIDGLEEFQIIGLMDRDPANVGKVMFGVPIIDKSMAEEKADIVIINTAETYWDIIYNRIQDIKIPIYYINGERAGKKEPALIKNPFRELSYSGLSAKLEEAEVISFDFFDTLFMRSVCSPQDVFRLIEVQQGIPFSQMRNEAKRHIRENYSLDKLYLQMEVQSGLSHIQMKTLKYKEIVLEKKLLVPRRQILQYLRELLEQGREVYIISDMYLPKKFYMEVLEGYGIFLPQGHILLSNDLDANKREGTLWKYYVETIIGGRSALHIGDNLKADVEEPIKYGMKTYLTPNVWELFLNSPLKNIAPHICSIYDTSVMGCVLDRLFENPFVFHHSNGTIVIKNNYDMGYCIFGIVILTFLLWLCRQTKIDKVKKLVFMSRDGYFLKEDLEYLCALIGEQIDCCYIGISRQLAMTASIETRTDLMEYASMPYTGNIMELFEDRFGIRGVKEQGNKPIDFYINEYLPEIEAYVAKVRKNYLHYIEKFELDKTCAVVDIGYYGNNQKYLNKLLQTRMQGYYFNANLSNENRNIVNQKMTACFQKEEDVTGENSQILKRQIYIESFLTAPYGMIKAVDKDGKFLYAPNGKNQECFKDKEEINEGVKQFITDYIERFGEFEIEPDREFADKYYGSCFSGGVEFTDEVKRSFYNDNAMMNRIESNLFY